MRLARLLCLSFLVVLPAVAVAQQGRPIVTGQACGGDLGGTYPDCTVTGGTNPTFLDATINAILNFIPTAGEPACAVVGDNWIKVNSTTGKMRGCEQGTVFDVNTPGGGTPQGPINSVQYNVDNANFGGSSRVSIDPASGALQSTCTRGTLDDCANELTSVPVAQSVPATANRVATYVKQTATVYEMCWNGNGDTGERCVDGSATGAIPNFYHAFDAASCTDGTTASANLNVKSGTATAVCETGGILADASLRLNGTGAVCVQRKWRLGGDIALGSGVNAAIDWKSDANAGTADFSLKTYCRGTDAAQNAGAWNPAVNVTAQAPSTTATGRRTVIFSAVALTGCAAFETLHMEFCQTAQTLSGGTNNTVDLLEWQFNYARQ